MQVEKIRQLLESGIADARVDVTGDGTHFTAVVVAAAFAGENRVRRHQRVYRALGDKVGKEIHALSIQAYTPEEWDDKKELRPL